MFEVPLPTAVNAEISPFPEAAKPIDELSFVQLYAEEPLLPLKRMSWVKSHYTNV